MNSIIASIIVVGGIGIIIGIMLSIAGKKFYVEVDEREEQILEALPGNNCGGCGYPGCSGLAHAIVTGEAKSDGCPVGGSKVAKVIAGIMGENATEKVREVAFVFCGGDDEKCKKRYIYEGVNSCKTAMSIQSGGDKACDYGCLGLGDCVKICPFNAISIKNGIAVVDKDKCKACKKCVVTCPKKIIQIIPETLENPVRCSSKDKGKDVNLKCSSGCIACKMCEKACEVEAIKVEDNLAHKDPTKCINCGKCDMACPKKCMA